MLAKSLSDSVGTLKKNPVLTLFYFTFMIFTAVVMFLLTYYLMPRNYGYMDDPLEAAAMFGRMMIFLLLVVVLIGGTGLLFLSGFGNMVSEAVAEGRTSPASLFPGIKKYFGRVVLAVLLFIAFAFGFGIVVALISMPFTIVYSLRSLEAPGMIPQIPAAVTVITELLSGLLAVGLLPFVSLWFPALFISDLGPVKSLVEGMRAAKRNYWILLLAAFVSYLPSMIFSVAAGLNTDYTNPTAMIFSPWYILMLVIGSIIGLFLVLFIFSVYNNYRNMHNRTVGQ